MEKTVAALEARIHRLEQRLAGEYRGPVVKDPPVEAYKRIVKDSEDPGYINRLLIATPTTGLVRMEWAVSRYTQTVPPNWSVVQMNQFMNGFIPLRYQVDDAQNLIVREVIDKDFEWLLLVEHDVMMPSDAIKRFDEYIHDEQVPVVSGLYYTRSRPSEPLLYRGRGNSFYGDWEFGDKVWVDGVPTGCLLIHAGILRAMWEESEEYIIQHPNGTRDLTRKVFNTPRKQWFDPETGQTNTTSGTSDLEWCSRIMECGFFAKAGWNEYQDLEYPFLVDTNIFCKHIDMDGVRYP